MRDRQLVINQSNGPMSVESKAKLSASKKGKKLFIDPVTGRR
jgi:hypothetical protein